MSGSESDEDFMPGEPEQLSEEDSADDETDLQYEQEKELKAQKRQAKQESTTKSKKKRKSNKNSVKPSDEEVSPRKEDKAPDQLDPEEEKKREEELWAKFLEGTDTKPKPKEPTSAVQQPLSQKSDVKEKPEAKATSVQQNKEDEKARERRIFEFAGEKIVVENDVVVDKIKSDNPAPVMLDGPSRSRGGGLSSVLGQLNKKNTLSTLEKSKLDWNTFKKVEGIDEELQNHNKGKEGYLERQDFLQRADLRTYEIERDLRLSRRSNR